MSKRLLHRGRYSRGSGVEHVANTNSPFPPQASDTYAATSNVPLYNTSNESQADQNAWTNPYTNPSSFPNQVPYNTYNSSSGWPNGKHCPMQPLSNETWNWRPDENVETSSYPNYQQPPIQNPPNQWQQPLYSQADNQTFSQQQSAYNSSQANFFSGPEFQPSNNSSDNVNMQPVFQSWENGSLNITQPEQLPWTYGAPQYCNSTMQQPLPDFSQNSNVAPSWSFNSDSATGLNVPVQDLPLTNYLPGSNSTPLQSADESQPPISAIESDSGGAFDSARDINLSSAPTNAHGPCDSVESNSELSAADYDNSALSAFFHNSEGNNSMNNSEVDGSSTPDIRAGMDSSSLADSISHLQIHDSEKSSVLSEVDADQETDNDGNHESNFVQKENLDSSDDARKSLSPSVYVEEPVNQEVPDSQLTDSSGAKTQLKQNFNQVVCEDHINQQIPEEVESRSASSDQERLVIRPREESPFKPPRSNSSLKGAIIQQEVAIKSISERKSQEKTIVQEVNLETFPDNLERPPDYEELRKQSPLYVSHQKHLRNDLNSSPSSLLCDNPDIPCVTLAPAAPPVHSSKSDQSEPPCDSKQEVPSFDNISKEASVSKEPSIISSTSSEPEMVEIAKQAIRATANIEISEPKFPTSSLNKFTDLPNSANEKVLGSYDNEHQLVYLKDSKIRDVRRNEPEIRELPRQHPGLNSAHLSNSKSADDMINVSKVDNRYPNDHLDNRQRLVDQKYPSFDERQYYSDRERSRPPSRSSLGERPDDYMYRKREDYMYSATDDHRRGVPEYHRPTSRMSENDVNRSDRHAPYDYYNSQYAPYPRAGDYYQKPPNYRGYEYDPYRRDPYYGYYDAYRYAYSNYNYGFYDELYRNDPRYRQYRDEQYRQYYAKYAYDPEYERSSVHSGRSSANEFSKGSTSNQYQEPDADSNSSEFSAYNLQQSYSYDAQNESSVIAADDESTSSARLTPVKFSYAHPIARFSPGGLLITTVPNQANPSLVAPVKIQSLQFIMENEDSFQELKIHQGPLIRGLTHKNDVIEFCTQKVKLLRQKEDVVDRDSHILLWELMILLLRQNGSVAGSDISELLLKDHEILHSQVTSMKHTADTPVGEPAEVNDSSSQSHAGDASSPDEGIYVFHDKTTVNTCAVDLEKVTRKFREFLLFGHKKDALEWAMKHGLWGHALFLASKMDLRTYANVMTRFANSLALNDPLQTLYQLMSGRQPSAVTCVADKKWGDWRPHLAMILSNPSAHPDVDSRSITTLGDTLASRGCLPAAHFCYVMAQVEFGTFEQKNSKLVLINADHRLSFEEFATNEAIQCTEIYEYAQSLANPGYMLPHLQMYKFIYALRLVEHGFLEEALHYCEVIAGNVQVHTSLFPADFISELYELSSRLKYHDPHFLRGQGELEEQDDPEWLKNLSILIKNYNNFLQGQNNSQAYCEQQMDSSQIPNTEQFPTSESANTYPGGLVPEGHRERSDSVNQNQNYYQMNNWNQQNGTSQNTAMAPNTQQDVPTYYQGEVSNNYGGFHIDSSIPSHEENETTDVPSSPVTQSPPFDYYSGGTQQMQENRQINYDQMNSYGTSSTHRERRDSTMSTGSRYSSNSLSMANKSSTKESVKTEIKKESKSNSQVGKTWLGGIFSRLLPKAPNQMILPDDKNPTIVWDEVKNCWVNKDSNDDSELNAPAAPPTDVELMGTKSSETPSMPPGNAMPPGNSVPPANSPPVNKFQRPKTRIMRHNYVDVLNTSGATMKSNVPPDALFPTTFENTGSPNMFIPSTAPANSENSAEYEPGQISYDSSQVETEKQSQAPLMLDPAEFDSSRSRVTNQRHSLGRSGRRMYPT